MLAMRFYGYVLMKCNDCSIGIVSVFNGCDDCIWCKHNEGVEKCKSLALPLAISSLTTLLLTLTAVLISWKFNLMNKLLSSMERLAKTNKRTKILRNKRKALKLKNYISDSSDDTEGTPNVDNNPKPLYPKTAHYLEVLGEELQEPTAPIYVRKAPAPPDESLTTLYTGFYDMADKQILCLKYADGNVDKIIIQRTEDVETFTPIYRTANYSLNFVIRY